MEAQLSAFFEKQELVPAIVQDAGTNEVLMLAYMNKASLEKTLETGYTWFYSRSRQRLWQKGEESGHVQRVISITGDCDNDTLLVKVEQTGPACHTGERTCFHRGELEPPAPHEVLPTLERTIEQRARTMPDGSYTAALLKDPDKPGAKVQEEAEEVARAAVSESDERVAEEAADLIYHLAVLLRGRGLSLPDAERVLDGRRK